MATCMVFVTTTPVGPLGPSPVHLLDSDVSVLIERNAAKAPEAGLGISCDQTNARRC